VLSPEAALTGPALRDTLTTRIAELLRQEHVIVRAIERGQSREFDARSSIASVEPGDEEGRVVLDVTVRFTARAQVRPDEVVALLVPHADARSTDVERVALWGRARRSPPWTPSSS
jgi:hypothetical protein